MLDLRPAILVPALTLVLGSPGTSQAPSEVKLTAREAALQDSFGISVALSGDTALVGAPRDDDAGPESGSAHVFVRSGTTWMQQAVLTAGDGAAQGLFGISVALSGDTALVGAQGSGSAYVFVRSGTSWRQQAVLTAGDAGDFFGFSVALSGDTALVGAPADDHAGRFSGSAHVFMRSATSWSRRAVLTASDGAAHDLFGFSVALSGDTALVGAEGSGSAHVFVRRRSWSRQAVLTAPDAGAFDSFGFSVALSGDTALVGAPDSGSAHVFVRGGRWIRQAKLTAGDGRTGNELGVSVALSGDRALAGAPGSGSARVFVRSGTSWIEQAKLTASDGAAFGRFGRAVALSGAVALVGDYRDDHAGFASGSAYVYEPAVALATVREFGTGCPGTLGVPILMPAAGSRPRTGETFDVALSNLPANHPAFLILGLSDTQWLSMGLPMSLASFGAPGCSLLVSGDFLTGVVNSIGTATLGFPIPLDPNLVGLHVYFQGSVVDPEANVSGVAVSNGLHITIGSF